MQVCQNIKQKLNPTWRRPTFHTRPIVHNHSSLNLDRIQVGQHPVTNRTYIITNLTMLGQFSFVRYNFEFHTILTP